MRDQALKNLGRYKNGPLFNPPIVGNVSGLLGAINVGNAGGGTNWPGGAYDPEMHILYVQAANSSVAAMSLAPPPLGFSDIRYLRGVVGEPFRQTIDRDMGAAADYPKDGVPRGAAAAEAVGAPRPVRGGGLNVQGLPIVKPPYGVLSAIDLDRGDLLWQVPHGDTPDVIRNHPALKAMHIPKTGQSGSVGMVVTKTLVIMGDPQVTTGNHPRGAMLRAYHKASGEQVGAVWMPAPQSGSPMTYMIDGKQYIVVAISGGGNHWGEYVAFALPESEIVSTNDKSQ
jgi:quinoprotein glucose dehydrogenase